MPTTVQSYRDLIAWQKAMKFVAHAYRLTLKFPEHELYGLVSQVRRSAISVPSNIAEGQGRRSTGEFRHFLGIARGSLLEVETQILLATELGYVDVAESDLLLTKSGEVARILNGLLNALEGDHRTDHRPLTTAHL